MTANTNNLRDQIDLLHDSKVQIVSAMRELVDDPGRRSVDRIEELTDRLRDYESVYHSVAAAVPDRTRDDTGPPTLETLGIAAERLEVSRVAASWVNRALAIRTAERAPERHPWFREARAHAQAAAVGELDPETADALAAGRHPLCALVRLVEQGNQLNDKEWKQHFDSVRARYGDGDAVAAARGRYQSGTKK